MPAEFHFIRPEWLLALPLVIAVTWLLARRLLAPGSWQGVVDPALVPYVLARSAAPEGAWRWWLMLLAGVIAVTALAGPSWDRIERPVYRSEQSLVVALDLSRSMDAQDLSPSRLARARLKILDVLERRRSGQTALVVYSANAFTVTPLTTDADTVASLVNSLSTDIMPSRGSYPVAAIEKGRQLLEQAGVSFGEVLLITDGGSSPAAEQAASELRDAGYTLSVLGVGTTEGAPIPLDDGGFVTDRSGRMAVPRLESRGLEALAAAGGGRYAAVTSDDGDIDRLLSGPVGDSAPGGDQATEQWADEGPWLVLLLVPLAALAFRRGWVLVLVVAIMPLPQPAHAAGWSDLWRTPDQQARELLEQGQAARAAELFEDLARCRALPLTTAAAPAISRRATGMPIRCTTSAMPRHGWAATTKPSSPTAARSRSTRTMRMRRTTAISSRTSSISRTSRTRSRATRNKAVSPAAEGSRRKATASPTRPVSRAPTARPGTSRRTATPAASSGR